MSADRDRAPELAPGHRLDGRYELLFPYAQGGMATVWLARLQGKHGFEKLVAIKTILPELAGDPSFRTMFLDEARIASRIRHPNVAQLDDLGEEAGTLFMVLEWIDGDSWAKLYNAIATRGQAFPTDHLLRIAADACAGLHAAHELRGDDLALLNVVHRDVSPQNILISNTGMTKVIDFGIAKARDRMAEQTRTGLLKGKAQYTAPEQVRMEPVDRRADLWAMGTILYQLLTGRLPYEAKGDAQTLLLLTSGKPPKPLPNHVPQAIKAVVMRALTPDPAGRFASGLEMQAALEAAITEPTSTNDVALLMRSYLSERMETRRREVAEALAEAADRARARGELPPKPASIPPPSHDRSAPPPPSQPIEEDVRTKVRGGFADLRPSEWTLLAVAALVPIVVWSLVIIVLIGALA